VAVSGSTASHTPLSHQTLPRANTATLLPLPLLPLLLTLIAVAVVAMVAVVAAAAVGGTAGMGRDDGATVQIKESATR